MALANTQKVETANSLVVKEGASASSASVSLKRRNNGDVFFADGAGNRYTATSSDKWAQQLFSQLKALV